MQRSLDGPENIGGWALIRALVGVNPAVQTKLFACVLLLFQCLLHPVELTTTFCEILTLNTT